MTEEVEKLPAGRLTCSVYTSPHATPDLDPLPALRELIQSAQRSLYFAVYSFTLADVAQDIIDAHKRGVHVQGVGDATTWLGVTSQLPVLAQAGLDIRQWGSRWRLMHDKVAVVDGERVALGSYNWSTQAEKNNVEVLLITEGTAANKVLAPTLVQQIKTAYAQGVST